MSRPDYKYRLMVHLAKALKEGKINKGKLVDSVILECFEPKSNPDAEHLKKRVLNYLENLLDQEAGKASPFVQIVSEYCQECHSLDEPCIIHCPTGAVKLGEDGQKYIDHSLCVECGFCVDSCIAGAMLIRSEFARVAAMLYQEQAHPVYAILAPSFVGQFGDASPTAIKAALKGLGFSDVYEVALAADIITLHEAREFVERMHRGGKFMITSCCCPVFIKLVEKVRPKVANLVSDSVSPMIALGKLLKKRNPDARVVFIGPCVAKKSEALLKDLQPAVDCVLTFKETSALFEATGLTLTGFGRNEMGDASHDGRAYAFTGGVTAAITRAVKELDPSLEIRAVKGDGVKECNRLLQELEEGSLDGNFMEGMGCPGGCVGGPGCNISAEKGQEEVRTFAQEAAVVHCSDNDLAVRWETEFSEDVLESAKSGSYDPKKQAKKGILRGYGESNW